MLYLSPTLLDSFGYYQRAEPSYADKARRDLIDRLRGVRFTSQAMQDGIDFENDLNAFCDGVASLEEGAPRTRCIIEMADYVRGAMRQVAVEYPVFQGITMRGYIDYLLANTISDAKTTSHYSLGKYFQNNQHLAYMAAFRKEGINRFRYLVTDFSSVYIEEYNWENSMLEMLKGNIYEFLDYLKVDDEMRQAFMEKQKRDAQKKEMAKCSTITM